LPFRLFSFSSTICLSTLGLSPIADEAIQRIGALYDIEQEIRGNALIKRGATSQLAAITCPSSRFSGQVERTHL
jgi:hypothetical protein